jgi:hypothetical protein
MAGRQRCRPAIQQVLLLGAYMVRYSVEYVNSGIAVRLSLVALNTA